MRSCRTDAGTSPAEKAEDDLSSRVAVPTSLLPSVSRAMRIRINERAKPTAGAAWLDLGRMSAGGRKRTAACLMTAFLLTAASTYDQQSTPNRQCL